MDERIKTEMISRRKALSLLGLGAALGFTLSSALEPLEAEAQEAAGTAAAPAAATGTHGMQRRQGRRTGRHERRHGRQSAPRAVNPDRPPQQLRRNRGPSAFERQIARSDGLGIAYASGGPRNARDRRRKEQEETKVPRHRRIHGKHLVMAELLRRGFEAEFAGASYEKHDMLVRVRGSRPKPIRIKTVHSAPWYVRWACLLSVRIR